MLDKLYVIAPISNPVRYKSRYALYKNFEKMVKDAGAELITVELAFGDRPHEITKEGNPNNLMLRSSCELWHKENLVNQGIERLPKDWKYVAWIDADIGFTRPDWVRECIQQLQHYEVVQLFSHAQDLGPKYEPIGKLREGFLFGYCNNIPYKREYGTTLHPGLAWAARRSAIDAVGGLIDTAILGSADYYMAAALVGQAERTLQPGLTKNYRDVVLRWQSRAERYLHRNVGYVDGLIYHHYHGSKRDRFYSTRWKILVDNKFDPVKDLKEDWQGLWVLDEKRVKLRDDIRTYMRSRNEDSIDV